MGWLIRDRRPRLRRVHFREFSSEFADKETANRPKRPRRRSVRRGDVWKQGKAIPISHTTFRLQLESKRSRSTSASTEFHWQPTFWRRSLAWASKRFQAKTFRNAAVPRRSEGKQHDTCQCRRRDSQSSFQCGDKREGVPHVAHVSHGTWLAVVFSSEPEVVVKSFPLWSIGDLCSICNRRPAAVWSIIPRQFGLTHSFFSLIDERPCVKPNSAREAMR